MTIWHKFQHRMGWWNGHVVSRRDQHNRVFIGFMCDKCSHLIEHDATNILDRHIDAHLIHNAARIGPFDLNPVAMPRKP
jgi:hypothetical protein